MSDPGPLPLSPLAAALWARAERAEPVMEAEGAEERLAREWDEEAERLGGRSDG